MSNAKTRVLLADDHAVVREGYRRLLERTDEIAVIARFMWGKMWGAASCRVLSRSKIQTSCRRRAEASLTPTPLPEGEGLDLQFASLSLRKRDRGCEKNS